MNEAQIKAWIFLATAIASQKEPSDFAGISTIADGINHSVPSQKEIHNSVSFLMKQDLIVKMGGKYKLSSKGIIVFEEASMSSKKLREIWKQLEIQIKNYE